jgi:hypothetical protein
MKKHDEKIEIIDGKEYITNFNEGTSYICIHPEYIKYWRNILITNDFAYVYLLANYTDSFDNTLKKRQKYMDVNDIMDIIGVSYDTTRKLISRLISMSVLLYHKRVGNRGMDVTKGQSCKMTIIILV